MAEVPKLKLQKKGSNEPPWEVTEAAYNARKRHYDKTHTIVGKVQPKRDEKPIPEPSPEYSVSEGGTQVQQETTVKKTGRPKTQKVNEA